MSLSRYYKPRSAHPKSKQMALRANVYECVSDAQHLQATHRTVELWRALLFQWDKHSLDLCHQRNTMAQYRRCEQRRRCNDSQPTKVNFATLARTETSCTVNHLI